MPASIPTKHAKFHNFREDKFRHGFLTLHYAPGELTLEVKELLRSLVEFGAEAEMVDFTLPEMEEKTPTPEISQ